MPLSVTYTFVPGAIIFASRFNQNFSDIETWANNHEVVSSSIHGVLGTVVGTSDAQSLSNKTLLLPKFTGAGAGTATVQYANTAVNHTYTIPSTAANDTFVMLSTLLTPSITNFTNAQHNHSNTANGGQLDWDLVWSDAVHSHASNAEGGLLDWDNIWSDAVHDHSSAGEGGNIPESAITDGSIFARLGDDETITGSWSFPSTDPPAANAITSLGLVKGWVAWVDSSSTIIASYNVSSITDNDGDGIFVINWNLDFASAFYAPFLSVDGGIEFVGGILSQSASACSIIIRAGGVPTDTDFTVMAMGAQ